MSNLNFHSNFYKINLIAIDEATATPTVTSDILTFQPELHLSVVQHVVPVPVVESPVDAVTHAELQPLFMTRTPAAVT